MRHPLPMPDLIDRLTGLLLGTAVGDALGLPAEGLKPTRIRKLWGTPWRHHLLFGRGMVSDDTEHTFFVGQALLAGALEPDTFQRALAWKLRGWFLGLPAGIGLSTLRAILKLWLGFPPHRAGVRSAGNGPAMRSALLGAMFADTPEKMEAMVRASTLLTHTDERACLGALAVARTAAWGVLNRGSSRPDVEALWVQLATLSPLEEWQSILEKLRQAWREHLPVGELARQLGLERGVTGYILHTVPVALYASIRHFGDFQAGLEAALDCGGDTDTVGAITGALLGAGCGRSGIPKPWLDGLVDWPRSRRLIEKLGMRLAELASSGSSSGPVSYFWPGVFPRNLFFLGVVLAHGFRRLAPPY